MYIVIITQIQCTVRTQLFVSSVAQGIPLPSVDTKASKELGHVVRVMQSGRMLSSCSMKKSLGQVLLQCEAKSGGGTLK